MQVSMLWSLLPVVVAWVFAYAGAPLVRTLLRHRPWWRRQPEDRQRFLARVPGLVVGFAIGVVLISVFPVGG